MARKATKPGQDNVSLSQHSEDLAIIGRDEQINQQGIVKSSSGEESLRSDQPSLRLQECSKGDITAIAYSPDGKLIATGDGEYGEDISQGGEGVEILDGAIMLWEAGSGRLLRTFREYPSIIRSLMFSPDSRGIVSLDSKKILTYWDLTTGRERWRVNYKGEMEHICFQKGGKAILAGNSLIDAISGKEQQRINDGNLVTLSPDGKIIASVEKNEIYLRDTETKNLKLKIKVKYKHVSSIIFNSDSGWVGISSLSRRYVDMNNPQSNKNETRPGPPAVNSNESKTINEVYGESKDIDSIGDETPDAPSDDPKEHKNTDAQPRDTFISGKHIADLASGNGVVELWEDDAIEIWDIKTGKLTKTIDGEQSFYFSPKGGYMGIIHSNTPQIRAGNETQIWDVKTWQLVRTHISTCSPAFDYNDQFLVASNGYGFNLRELRSGQMVRSNDAFVGFSKDHYPNRLYLTPDGKHMVWNNELLETATYRLIRSFPSAIKVLGFNDEVMFVSYSKVTGPTGEYTIEQCDLSSGRTLKSRDTDTYFNIFSVNRDITKVAYVVGGFSVVVWDIPTDKSVIIHPFDRDVKNPLSSSSDMWLRTLVLTGQQVTSCALSPDGKYLLCGYRGIEPQLWEIDTGEKVWPVIDPSGPAKIKPASFIKDNTYTIASALDARSVFPDRSVVEFSPDGKMIAVGWGSAEGGGGERDGQSGRLYIIDRETGKVLKELASKIRRITCLAFSPDSKLLVTGSGDYSVKVWNPKTGTLIHTFSGHTAKINWVRFSSSSREKNLDGKFIFSLSDDGSIKVWQAPKSDTDNSQDESTSNRTKTIADRELCTIVRNGNGAWVIADSKGHFNTNNLDNLPSVHWIMPDDQFKTLPLEIFTRDYYMPGLLPKLLDDILDEQQFKPVRPLAELNRAQPLVKITKVEQHKADPSIVSVTTGTSEGEYGPPQSPSRRSGIYDLRLFRDGQLVEYDPKSSANIQAYSQLGKQASFDDELKVWRSITQFKPDPKTGNTRTFTVRLPRNKDITEVEFSAYAFNDDRVKSETYRETYKLPQPLKASVKGKAYLVTIGVGANENPRWNLFYTVNDARRMHRDLYDRLSKQYDQVVSVPLVSDYGGITKRFGDCVEKRPTREAVRTVLDLLAGTDVGPERKQLVPCADQIQKAGPEDLVLISFSGHGYGDGLGNYYLFPYDTGKLGENQQITDNLPDELLNRLISSEELSAWMRDIDAGEFVMILDACQSEAATGKEFKPGPMGSRGLGQLAYDKGMRMLVATQADNQAVGLGSLSHGLLTYALTVEGLEKAEKLTIKGWLERAAERVPQLYEEKVLKEGRLQSKVQQPGLFDFAKSNFTFR